MISGLHAAKDVLEAALDRYSTVLSTIVNLCGSSTLSQAIHHAISPELEAIATYETKLKRTKAIVSRTRNSNWLLVPINALPSDILTQIFELLIEMQPRYCAIADQNDTLDIIFRHPNVLTRVCSRWRRVAIESRSLWTGIGLAPLDKTRTPFAREHDLRAYAKLLITRANLFLSRAGQSQLDVYFDGGAFPHQEVNTELTRLCKAVAPRARRLEFGSSSFGLVDFRFFRKCMGTCTPGILRQLVILGGSCVSDGHSHFIDGGAESMDSTRWLLDIPHQELEEVLLLINVMHLKGRYFRWESQAYHGLVELRLTTSGMYSETRVPITITNVAQILAASPRLRLLHFDLRIEGPHLSYQPTPLRELEVLNLCSMDANQCGMVLQLIAPGPKPLQLLMRIAPRKNPSTPIFSHNCLEFFSRSNIRELKICQGQSVYPHRLPDLLSALPLPGLCVLALNQFALDLDHSFPGDRDYPSIMAYVCSRLEFLQLSNYAVDMNDLRWAAEAFPISQLQVSQGWLVTAGIDETHGIEEVQNKLVEAFPEIYPKPVTWDVLLGYGIDGPILIKRKPGFRSCLHIDSTVKEPPLSSLTS